MSDPILYFDPDAFKATQQLDETTDGSIDADVLLALDAASRAVEVVTDRKFFQLDASNDQVRLFSSRGGRTVLVDDLLVLTSLEVDQDGDGVFETVVASSDVLLQPPNAALDGRPWERITFRRPELLPSGVSGGVRVTGRFGWPVVPIEVVKATEIIAVKLFKRPRDAPWSVVAADVQGAAIRIGSYDAEVQMLLKDLKRTPVVG